MTGIKNQREPMDFQDLILNLQNFWSDKGCLLIQPYDLEKGAGTFNPATFLRALGPEPFCAAYVEPCRRPADGRYGENPIRTQHYYQFQVVMKPNPRNILELYLDSLKAIGIHPEDHDIRLVHDDWETAALSAWGLGWEVWCDGTEITQFTYFQQVGGIELRPITGEITYGLERLCMFLQGKDNFFDMQYNKKFTYGDLFHQNEVQFSRHNFEYADVGLHLLLFERFEKECKQLCETRNPLPALDYLMKASHSFNLLDSRKAISVNERQGYVLKLQNLARMTAESWLETRQELNFPLLEKAETDVPPNQDTFQDSETTPVNLPAPAVSQVPLLIELGVEEMPAAVFKKLLQDLPRLWKRIIGPFELKQQDLNFFVTPRRIVITVGAIDNLQKDKEMELRGPPARMAKDENGEWSKAALGFAKKNHIEPGSLQIKRIGQAKYLYVVQTQRGKSALEIFAKIIPQLFSEIHWYKTMRWEKGDTSAFVRPVKWLVAMLGKEVIPCNFAGVSSSNKSRGHRFLSNREIPVTPDSYLHALEKAFVLVDHRKRMEVIRRAIQEKAVAHHLQWRVDEELLNQVTHMVEFPFPILGTFDKHFLQIPEEVIVSEMREHQKYFALTSHDGELHHSFIAISNMLCNNMDTVRKGYESVLVSRLRDGEFFLQEDRKIPLKKRVQSLKTLTFESRLGTVWEKVQRIEKLSLWIAENLQFEQKRIEFVREIAELSKADLTTAMVFEFPELQGEIGRYYALQEKYPLVVAEGIRYHYLPRYAADNLPGTDEAAVVAIADRIDSITGLIGVGKTPTGSSDPFALRRACLGCISILLNRGLSLSVDELINTSIQYQSEKLNQSEIEGLGGKIMEFFLSRIRVLLQEKPRPGVPGGFNWDTIDSVLSADTPWHDLPDLVQRIRAMHLFRERDDFSSVATTYKRVSNILEQDLKGSLDTSLLTHPSEKALLQATTVAKAEIRNYLKNKDYLKALSIVGTLKTKVDELFDGVLINDTNRALRTNRHLLIRDVRNLVSNVADFSIIQE